jgi:hypothetical protein
MENAMGTIGPLDAGALSPLPEPDATSPEPKASAPAPEPAAATRVDDGGRLAVLSGLTASAAAPNGGDPSVNLDASGVRRPVALTGTGRFTAQLGAEPASLAEAGEGLYAAAKLIDDTAGNLFDEAGVDTAARRRVLESLRGDLGQVPAGGPAGDGLDELAALQLRSAGGTVLLELMTAHGTPDDLQREAFAIYRAQIGAETNPILKDGMALHLDRLRDALPADLQPGVDAVRDVFAPQRPPYERWFADGNDTVKVDWIAQSHQWDLSKAGLEADGYELVSDTGSERLFQRTYEHDGVETRFEVRIRRSFSGSGIYDGVADADGAHMEVYTGHSSWGKNMRSSLDRAPDSPTGGEGKLVLTSLCAGKGEIQMFRDKFPSAHLVTSHNSTKFSSSSGRSEGVQAFLSMARSIARREDYDGMAAEVKDNNPFRWTHDHEWGIDNNYLFPSSTAARRRVLDRDGDGQADVLDRVVDFDTFAVSEDTRREFAAKTPARPADELLGTNTHFAAMNINRMALFSDLLEDLNATGNVLPGGFFEPAEGETALVRFEPAEVDGDDVLVLRVNGRYAHMSEEALRLATAFEYAARLPELDDRWRLDATDTKLNALLFAANSLYSDAGYRDDEVWAAFTDAYGLQGIDLRTVERARASDDHAYSGSRSSMRALRDALDPAALDGLADAGAGRFIGG